MSDEELREIHRAFDLLDPVPPRLLDAAAAAFAFRDLDARLAVLVTETPLTGMRSATRLLTFEGPGVTVELVVAPSGRARLVTGRVTPPLPARLLLHTPTARREAALDATGHFVLDAVPQGLVMLAFHLPDGTSVTTSWARL